MLKYDKSKAKRPVLPAGTYSATIADVQEMTSKKGAPMYRLRLTTYDDGSGQKVSVFDYLLIDHVWRIEEMAKALGKADEFESEEFDPADYIDEAIGVELTVEQSDEFGDSNRIKKFIADPAGVPF